VVETLSGGGRRWSGWLRSTSILGRRREDIGQEVEFAIDGRPAHLVNANTVVPPFFEYVGGGVDKLHITERFPVYLPVANGSEP
jgi:hypothetical protein